jgi:hypothetical protein
MTYVPSVVDKQRRLRIMLSLYAYAYEFKNRTIVSDADFDRLALEVDLTIDTGNVLLDNFFNNEYNAYTGQWIHKHPEKNKLEAMYMQYDMGYPDWLFRSESTLYDLRNSK